jgi:hypothetical protein
MKITSIIKSIIISILQLKIKPSIVVLSAFLFISIIISCSRKKDIPVSANKIKLTQYRQEERTSIYRADISHVPNKRMKTIVVQDSSAAGGSDGIYTGFDIDFLLLDIDGVFDTKDDRIKLNEDSRTQITPGKVQNQDTSFFRPTITRPGKLFGLNKENRIDFSLATLSLLDAYYDSGLDPDTSTGWLSLGDKGILYAHFDLNSVDLYPSLYLFIGEVGTGFEEQLDVDVKIVE